LAHPQRRSRLRRRPGNRTANGPTIIAVSRSGRRRLGGLKTQGRATRRRHSMRGREPMIPTRHIFRPSCCVR
jgi:hypothetical protein